MAKMTFERRIGLVEGRRRQTAGEEVPQKTHTVKKRPRKLVPFFFPFSRPLSSADSDDLDGPNFAFERMAFVALGGAGGGRPTFFEMVAAERLMLSLKSAAAYSLSVRKRWIQRP